MKQRNKRSLKITDAVVRGGKNYYEFEVFPIETEFESQSAVYIFSERKTDKSGRGHQKFFCIGQTDSLDGDFARYKKQFASKYRVNVICVRIEEEEESRRKIEDELKVAYNISCSNNLENAARQVEKPRVARQISQKIVSTRQIEKPKPPAESPAVERKIITKKKIHTAARKTIKVELQPKKIAAGKKTQTKLVSPKSKPSVSTASTKKPSRKTNPSIARSKPQIQTVASKSKKVSAVKNKPANKSTVKNAKRKTSLPSVTPPPVKKPKAKIVQKSKQSKNQQVARKPKNGKKVGAPITPKKVSTVKNVKAKGNGKSNGKMKLTAAKKSTIKNEKAAVKNGKTAGSRKQLAF